MKQVNIIIREAVFDDLQQYRRLRLESLRLHPEAFGRDYETEKEVPLSEWKNKFIIDSNDTIFVAQAGDNLIGIAGIRRSPSIKTAHNAGIWGVYVSADFRGEKVGEKLIEACVQWAKQKNLFSVRLSVVTTNVSAIRLYLKCGFQVYGVEPKAIKVDQNYFDEFLMVRILQ